MLRIHDELRRNTLPNCTKLCKLLEVSRKTVIRDIAFMRDRLDLPIEFDLAIQSYRYTHPVSSFPTVNVTEGELLALLVARRALEQYQGTPFHRQLEVAFEKLTGGLKERISFSPADELGSVSFKNIGLGKADLVVFNALSAAVLKQQEVEFDYRKPGESKVFRRRIQPYHLSHRENLWYLVGQDTERAGMRTFALPRITAVRMLHREFSRPPGFSPEQFFSSALGVMVGTGNHAVKVRFAPEVADRVRERVWHETQRITDLPDGGIELTVQLGALAEVERWILGWGPQAEVIGPPELRQRMGKAAKQLQAIYKS